MNVAPKLTILIQVALFAGLTALAVAVYNLAGQVRSFTEAGAQTGGGVSGARQAAAQPQAGPRETFDKGVEIAGMAAFLQRLASLERHVAEVANLVASIQMSQPAVRANAQTTPGVPSAELREKVNLPARFAKEPATSDWGETAAGSVNDGWTTHFSQNPFFQDYGGEVVTDCRETVCSLTWSPDASVSGSLSPDEKGALLELAKLQLLALAGRTNGGGQVVVKANPDSAVPSIEVLVEHGDPPTPELTQRLYEKLGISTKAQ
jgi:hypothetical protein